jgi:hypothetical protein
MFHSNLKQQEIQGQMKKVKIKLQGFKVIKNEDTLSCKTDYSELIKTEVESTLADAFENDCPNTDWLELLAEKELGYLFQMDSYEVLTEEIEIQ